MSFRVQRATLVAIDLKQQTPGFSPRSPTVMNGKTDSEIVALLWPEKGFWWRQTLFLSFQIQKAFLQILFTYLGKPPDFFFDT